MQTSGSARGKEKLCKRHTQTNKRKAHCTPGTPQGQYCQLCHTEKGQLPLPFRPLTWCPGQKEVREETLEAHQLPRPNHSQDPVLWGFSQQLLGYPPSGCGLRCSVCTGECREEHARPLGRPEQKQAGSHLPVAEQRGAAVSTLSGVQ